MIEQVFASETIRAKVGAAKQLSGIAQADQPPDGLLRLLKDAKVGGAWAWHQDYGYWYQNGILFPNLCSVMIAVDKATEENGCMQVPQIFTNFPEQIWYVYVRIWSCGHVNRRAHVRLR